MSQMKHYVNQHIHTFSIIDAQWLLVLCGGLAPLLLNIVGVRRGELGIVRGGQAGLSK